MSRRTWPLVATWLLLAGPGGAQDVFAPEVLDAERLRRAGLQNEAGLLALVVPAPAPTDAQLAALLKALTADDYEQRSRAGEDLVRLGRPARAALLPLLASADPDLVRLARLLVDEIDARLAPSTTLAVLRTLCRRQHPRAAELLLEHLPHLEANLLDGLHALLLVDPKQPATAAALRAALGDVEPSRRLAAGLTLARLGDAKQAEAVVPLLKDPDPRVCLRTAQGLLGRGDERGLPVLVELLPGPLELAWQAEELLRWAAADSAPTVYLLAGTAKTRKPCQDAWAKWLADPARRIDWAALRRSPRRPGLYLTCRGDRLALLGGDGTVRFLLENTQGGSFTDAHLLPDGRFLVFDDNDAEVRICEPSGKVVKKWRAPGGEIAQTLQLVPGEKRIIAITDEQIHELSWDCKHLGSTRLGEMFFLDACLVDAGRYAALTDEGFYLVDRTTGRILSELRIPGREDNIVDNGKLIALPDGLIGLASPQLDRLLVFDLGGQVAAGPAVKVRTVQAATRYRSGNWMLSQPTASGRLAEIAPDGRVVREVLVSPALARVRLLFEDLRLGLDDEPSPGFNVDTPAYRIAALKGGDLELRRRSAALLGQYKEASPQIIPALIDALNTNDLTLQMNAARALAAFGADALPPLLTVVREGSPAARLNAVRGMAQMRATAAPAVPDLVVLLRRPLADPTLRTACCEALGQMGQAANAACPALRDTFAVPELTLRNAAVAALGAVGKGEPENVAALLALLDHKEASSAAQAATALGKYGGKARATVPHFVRLLGKVKESAAQVAPLGVRLAVVNALSDLGHDAADAVPALAAVIRDGKDDAELRQNAIRALGRLGPAAAAALPALQELLLASDRPSAYQQEIFRALVLLKHDGGIGVLLAAARSGGENLRYQAISTLGSMGREAHSALPTLKELQLAEKSPRVKSALQRAIARIPLPPSA